MANWKGTGHSKENPVFFIVWALPVGAESGSIPLGF